MGKGLKIALKLSFNGLRKIFGKTSKTINKTPQVATQQVKTLPEQLAGIKSQKPSELDIIFDLFQENYGDKLPANFKEGLSKLSEKDLKVLHRSIPGKTA